MNRRRATATPRIRGKTITEMMRSSRAGLVANDAEERASRSLDAMRQVYEEQAARGIPEAIEGLALIEQGLWPSSGRPMPPRNVPDQAPDG
jgi:hypothetical protein